MLQEKIIDEVIISKRNKSSTLLLKQFVLTVVEEALINVYGKNYSTRCLQSSLGIKRILHDFGIESYLREGFCCFPIIRGNNPYDFSWGGFWNNDHHVWLQSELFEIIDFTISKLNHHPNFVTNNNVQPIPIIWWSPANVIPTIFKYLPRFVNMTVTVELSGKEKEDLDDFFIKIDEVKNRILKANSINFSCEILEGVESLANLYEKGNHWAVGSYTIYEKNINFPDWMIEKEIQLINELGTA